MNEQEVKKLYQALLSKGYSTQDLGDEQRFLSKMGDANNRKQLYDWVSSKGNFRIGDFNAYEARLTGGAQQEQPSTSGTQDFTMKESELEGKQEKREAQKPQQPTVNIPSVADMMEEHKKRTAMPPVFQSEVGLDEEGNRVTKPKVENVHVPGTPSPQVSPVYSDFMGNEYDATDPNVQKEADSQVHTQQIDLLKTTREQVENLSGEINDAINKRGLELDKAALDPKNSWQDMPRGSGPLVHTFNSSTANGRFADMQWNALNAARNAMTDAKRIIQEADHNAKDGTFNEWVESSFAGGAARGFGQKLFDVRTWDMGLSEGTGAAALYDALQTFDSGKTLTEAQRLLLDAKAVELATNAYFGSYVGRGYKAGNVTAESVPFMIEMCLNPASGTGHAAQNAMARYAIKRFGKNVVKDNAKKYLATKVATRVAGDIAGSSVMAATTGSVGVTADAINRMNGDVQYETNDEGLSVFAGHTEGDDFGEAFGKAFASRTIENYSEMMGEYFAPVLGWAGKDVRKGLGKVGLEGVNDFIENVAASDVARVVGDFEKNAKWNGVFGEYAEEVAGGIMNALVVGDQTLDADPETGVFNLDNNIDTFLGVSLMGGFMSGIKTAGYRTPKYRARQDMMAKDDAAASVFGNQDTWGEIRNTIAVGDDADAKRKLAEVLGNPDFTPEQRAAALDYAKAVQAYRGMLKGEEKRREEQDPTQTDLETSFDNGYSLESNQEMNDAKNMLDYQRQRIGEFATDDMLNQLDADPVGALNAIRVNEAWTDEEKQTATDYVNAKATYDGMIQHVQDDIESQINASNSLIDGRVHPDDGMIHPATMKTNDRKVYVIGGNLAMNDDGTMVDRENSDESIIVRDAETGSIEFTDPRDVLSTDETIDAAQEKQIAQESIRQQYAQEAANKIDGVLPFNEGDTYQVVDGDGELHTVTVAPVPVDENGVPASIPEGEVLVSIDGTEPIPVQTEQVQQMADNANLARLAEFEQGKAAQREAEAEAEREANRPVYNINDEITLQTDEGTVRGSITADANEDGLIEVYTERPIGGKKINLYNRDELDAMVVQHNGVAQEPAAEAEPQPTEQPSVEAEEEAADDAMPMIGEGDEAEPDFMNTTPERAHSYIYNESGLSRDEANQFVEANKKAADKALEKAKNTKPKMGTSLAKYRKEQTEYQQKVDAAQKVADYWKKVKDAQQLVLSAEQEERAKQNEAVHEQAVIEEQARQAEELRKREEQAALGTNNVAPAIREKWEAAPKVEGARNEIVLANGEHVPGRYVLVESGAATPSHNPRAEFAKNEGFPQDENGQSVNDRDYERDKDAQSTTRQIASIYDQRALQTPVVVTNDGIVLSGNGRTMAGELAANDNTDGAYIEHLKQYGSQFGFAPEQVEGMQHPRVVFVPDEAMPYTADTFAKFNQQEMKGQNKTEQAVKLGKIVDDDTFGRIIRGINGYNTLGEYYADTQATTQAINELRDAGAISQAQYGEMFDGETISAQGREMLENMLIGKAFESNPDAVRQITAFKGVRQGIITALAEISNNIMLGDEYSHEADLAQAINLVYQARNAGYKAGEKVSNFARQLNLFPFDEGATVADADNATVLMFADLLNEGKPTLLKKALALYNQAAKDSANGQLDIFSGDVRSKEEILDEVRQLLKYGTEEQQQAALDAATAERVAASQPIVQEDGTAGTGNQGSTERSNLAQTEVTAPLSDEVNEYDKPFVLSSDGTSTFGEVTEDSGLTAAPIKLSLGENTTDEKGDNHGYGLLHIEAGHGEQIRAAGFASIEDFVETVARNYDTIREGNVIGENQTYLLEVSDEHNNTLFIQLSRDGGYWNVNSAGIFRKKYSRRMREVASLPTIGNSSNTETVEVNRGQTKGATATSENSSLTSEDKSTEKSANSQEKQEKSVNIQQNKSIAAAEREVNVNPTDAQKEAGNYKKGHVKIDGYDVTIENPKGSERSGTDASGKQWRQAMHNTYGYIRGTEGVDGDHIDVFLSDAPESGNVYVIDQRNADGSFDEHKVMYGFNSAEEARDAYLSNYEEGWQGLGAITEVSKDEFKKWIDSSHRKTKPFADYKSVKPIGAQNEGTAEPQPIGVGSFGNIYDQFRGKAKEAIDFLQKKKSGEAIGALHHKDIGDIDLVWGEEGTGKSDGYGLAKLVKYHPDVLDNLQEILDDMHVTTRSENRVNLESDTHQAAVRLTWDNQKKTWLLTAFEKKNSVPGNTTDTDETSTGGKQNDTATLQNTVSEGKGTEKSDTMQENGGKTSSYSVTPKEYVTKKGKKLAMHLVKFDRELTPDEYRKAKALAKKWAGWWSREDGGFLMRDEMAAETFANTVLDAEALEDEQPLSLQDMATAMEQTEAEQEENPNANYKVGDTVIFLNSNKTARLKGKIVRVDKTESFGTEYEVESIIVTDNGPGKGVTSRPHTYTILEGQIKSKVAEQPKQTEQSQQTEQPKRLVSDERMEELKARLRKKMFGQLNMGVDPEILAIGAELAVGHIERGLTKFADYAKTMIEDLGEAIRPYLKAFYNAVRDMPEAEEYAEQMDSYDDVRKFDLLSIRPEGETSDTTAGILERAEEISKELDAEEQAAEAKEKLTEQRNDGRKVQSEGVALDGTPLRAITEKDLDNRDAKFYHQGKRVYIFAVMRSGEQVSATQFSEPHLDNIYLTNGQSIKPEELMVADETKEPVDNNSVQKILDIAKKGKKPSKSKKKDVTLQSPSFMGDLFNENTEDNGHERTDAARTEGLPADSTDSGERSLRANGQEVGQESGRADRRRTQGGVEPVRQRLHDGLRPSDQLTNTPTDQRRTRQPLERPSNPKNLRNNHAERGKNYAPKGVDARIEANIKAIELMKQLMESGEQATPEQMAVLRQFSGWGGLGKAFENFTAYTNGKPTPQYLRELLGEEAYQQANMSRNSAYYTPANVIDAMWDVAKAMGFQGGNVLEGSAGIGDIIGHMPTDMSERSNIHAVEIDQTTGNILSLLYPDAKVDVQGFEATQVENGSIDLAITNVPFVTGLRVNDTTGDKDLSKKFHDIHDFCIAKNVRKLREGGIGIFITSSGTLDNSAKLREWIIQEGGADVVGAFRMHNETFGGTGATSDIIVVRKRVNGMKSTHAIDVLSTTGERTADYDTGETKRVKGQEIPIIKHLSMDYNSYFVEHPEMMAGEMHFGFEKGETFRPTSKALYPSKDKNQDEMLKAWAESFAEKEWESYSVPNGALPDGAVDVYEDLGEGVKEGSIVVSNGQLCIAQRGKAVPLAVNANKVKGKTKVQCFEAYQDIKKALADLLQYQTENEDDAGLKPLLQALNKAYDSFVKTYGHLHKNTAISFLKNDVDFANIVALESFTELGDGKGGVTREYGKTDIFSQRVVDKEKAPEPKDVKDGIIASIYVHGRIDLPWIVDKLNAVNGQHTEESVKAEIIASGLGFENPATRQMEVSYEYLSGNVREKLAQAQANNSDGRYDANIKALEAVIPMNIPAHLIDFSIGSSWIDPKLYEEYVKEKTDIDVKFTTAGGTWFMKTPNYVAEQKNRAMGVVSEMLHKTIMGTQLIEAAMQNKTITVSETHKKWDGSTETITDKEATQACSNKIDEIRQDFKDWARAKMQSDPTMSEHIEHIYNEMFNNYVPKSIPDEFVPAHFGGAATMVDGKEFALRPHQAKAAIRGTTQPLLLAHEVGSGKTYTLITTAMEMRRLGIARKPMAVVQNATVGQFVESAKKLYPNAKVLTIEEADRTAEGRKNFYAKIKYNDWDMIVVPQSVFERIPDSEERQMKFVQDKIEEKLLVLEQMKDSDPQGQSMIVRQAEKEIENLIDELAGLTDTISTKRKERDEKKRAVTMQNAEVKALEMLDRQTDDVENFDDMGIDAILVDEAHEYKHLGFATAMQRGVKGVDPSYSKKAQGVYLKTQAVLEKNNGRNVIFATGTPISNTAAEIWTFMRYLMPSDTMKEYGIFYFDDFVRNFGNLTQMLEFTTSGKFKENNRFAGYINLPELVRIWAGVADTVLNKDIEAQRIAEGKESKIPDMEDGKATDIYLPQTRALRSIMKFVKKKLDEYDKMSGKEKKENSHIPLTMYGIAKAAAVDARLVMSDAEDDPNSKTNEAVRQILKSLKETASYKGTVAVFADNYQNKHSGFNLYEDIREKLIAKGVPAEQIVVMKSGMSVKKKLEIFDKVNRGEVRVIMGSTFTLGTGVNIQERLHTLIHLDAPNRPMDYTQRNGRILRQGNLHKDMNKPVRVLRFGVEDSLDVTAYQRLKTKGAIADSIMNGKQMMANSMENRALEEEEDVFGDTVAQLSGSEYAMLKNQAEKDVRKYEAKKKQYEADQTYCHNEIPRLEGEIKTWKEWLEKNRANLAKTGSLPTEKIITVGKQTFASIDAMADFIKEYNKTIKEVENDLRDNPSLHSETRRLTVNVGGIDFVFTTEQSIETKQDQGTLFSAVRRKMTYSCEAFGLKDVPVRQSLLREGLEDIVKNVVSGKDFQESIERGERNLDRCEKSLAQIRGRFGKPFEYSKELATAHERLDEYAELMKKELEEKEKKYAEMDADVDEATNITEAEEAEEEDNDDEDGKLYRMREEEPPVRTGIGYKVFVLKDGKLYPPMVANPNGEDTPVGAWLNADAAPIAGTSKTGRAQVKAGGKGTQGGSGTLAYRPGWHLGVIPYALQFNRKNPKTGEKELFPANFVWAEVEYANDVDYQQEAYEAGVNENGKYQHALAGLKRVPENGSYTYRTNPNPETDPWIITGAMKVRRILKPSEVDELVKAAGREPQQREAGAVTDEQVEALNKEIRIKEVHRRYDELNEKYHGKPYKVVLSIDDMTDEELCDAIGVSDEEIAALSPEELHNAIQEEKEDIKKQKTGGGYSPSRRKITIFAENISSQNKTEEAFFHENVHGILHDWYGDSPRTIAERFWDVADDGLAKKSSIIKSYDYATTEGQKEEFFVYWLSRAMVKGRVSEMLDMLTDEDSERVENILSTIGYDRRTEEASRRAKEAEGGKEATDRGQTNLGRHDQGLLLGREGQGSVSYEESLASSRAAGYTKKQHEAYWKRTQRNMRFAADYAIRKLGLGGRVSVLENPEGLKGRKAKAKGWYDAATGKIVVILSNHGSTSDVIKTVLHEGVAHFGLRKLFGSHFNQFLDNVYQYADSSVRSNIVELAKKHNWDFHTATEEYLARLAEDTNFEKAYKQGWWTKIKSMFLNMLHSIGLADYGGAVLTDNELRYILWRSYENLAEPGMYRNPFRVAEDVVMQSNLGIGNYEKSISRIFSSGGLDMSRQAAENMVAERDGKIHFRDGDFSERDRATARDEYERMVSSGTYQFREAVQDSMLGLEKLYKAILGKDCEHIENVDGYENAYLAENRMSSVNAAEQHDYYVNFMQPLLEAIGAIAGSKKGARQALTDYMMAKHGLERNLVFAERDAREVEANGGDFADAFKKFRENDYSGLTALTGEKDLAAAEAAAQQIVDDYEAAYDTSDLWNRTREATQATLEKIYRSGLLSREQYEKIRDMFQYYIPLQGWDETTSDEVYGYLTSRSGIGGSPIKHAVGRSSKADDPIATIAMMADSAIRQGNRNQMKQRFLNFVLNHPSDLVSVHDLWLEYDAAADEWKPVFADIEDGDTAADVERKVEAFEQRMAKLAEAEPDRYKRGSDAKNIPYKVVKGNLKEHQVLVKRGGQTYVLTINGNPRAAQALNGLTNPDVELNNWIGNIARGWEKLNRWKSELYTTRKPDFVVSNLFRDLLYSNCMTWIKESPRYALRFHKNFGRMNYIKMRILLGKWEKGTLDQGNYTERMFYQFMMNGGETGYTSVLDIEKHKKEIAKELKRQGSIIRKAWAALGMQLDLLNKMIENCARFAAFVTSREMGRSIDRSIYDAKEVSVNFNKKGSGGKMVNATGQTFLGKAGSYIGGGGRLLFVFWNAGVQGMTNFGRAGKRHPAKAFAGASAMFILGYVIPLLAEAMGGGDGDDDDKNAYYNLPEYVRRSNICFRVGEQWITIPLSIEFRGIYGLGELASGYISGNEYYDNKELAYQMASQVSQILPLDILEGGGGWHALTPNLIKAGVEAYGINRSWNGLPIYKDTPWNQNDPEWTKAYKNTDQTLVAASKWLNEFSGGDDFKKGAIDINPAKLEYFLSDLFGGYSDTAEKLKKMGETALGNRDFDWRNMLLANRIVKSGDERTANRKLQNEYFKYEKEYEDTKRLLNKYESAADEGILGMAEKYDFLYNSPEYMRYELFDEYKSDIDDYREEIQEASDDAERKELESDMYATMRELIDQLHEIK